MESTPITQMQNINAGFPKNTFSFVVCSGWGSGFCSSGCITGCSTGAGGMLASVSDWISKRGREAPQDGQISLSCSAFSPQLPQNISRFLSILRFVIGILYISITQWRKKIKISRKAEPNLCLKGTSSPRREAAGCFRAKPENGSAIRLILDVDV